jgi:hypothetical protein
VFISSAVIASNIYIIFKIPRWNFGFTVSVSEGISVYK